MVSRTPDGGFVVAWLGFYQGVLARRFGSDGGALSGELVVNTYTFPNLNTPPALAVEEDGSFLVSWSSFRFSGADTLSGSIQSQRFSPGGTVSAEPKVSSVDLMLLVS